MTEKESRTGIGPLGVIGVFVGGALCGGIAALLTAPRSGKETRKLIGDGISRQTSKVAQLREAGSAAKEAFTHAMASSH
jgi:gas vesicle protein